MIHEDEPLTPAPEYAPDGSGEANIQTARRLLEVTKTVALELDRKLGTTLIKRGRNSGSDENPR